MGGGDLSLRSTATSMVLVPDGSSLDTLAERLRRRPAKPMGSPRVGSNATGVDMEGQWSAWPVIVCYQLRIL